MNPGERSYFESRLTDLLLGELTAEEAAELRQAIGQDAELAAAYERLKQTIELVRESTASPKEKTTLQPVPLKLSDDRRQKLLAQFKTVELKKADPKERRFTITLLEVAAVVAILGLLAAIVSPTTSSFKMREPRSFKMGQTQTDVLENAKYQLARENRTAGNDTTINYTDASKPLESGQTLASAPAPRSYSPVPATEPATTPIFLPGSGQYSVALGGAKKEYDGNTLSTPGPFKSWGLETGGDNLSYGLTPKDSPSKSTFSITTDREITPGGHPGALAASGGMLSLEPRQSSFPGLAGNSLQNSGTIAQTSTMFTLGGPTVSPKLEERTGFSSLSLLGSVGDKPGSLVITTNSAGTVAGATLRRDPSSILPSTLIAGRAEQTIAPGSEPTPESAKAPAFSVTGIQPDQPRGGAKTKDDLLASYEAAKKDLTDLTQVRQNLDTKIASTEEKLMFVERDVASSHAPYVDAAKLLNELHTEQEKTVAKAGEKQALVERLQKELESVESADVSPSKPAAPAAIPQPEIQTRENAFSTFSLNVSDVSFKLAAASLEKGVLPEPVSIRTEEFINAFNYRDPEPAANAPIAFVAERAHYPFAHNRDLLRFSIKTAAAGRQPGRPLNLVLLLDNSGSMERADRVRIIQQALRVLAGQLQPQDKLSVVTFARTASLRIDGQPGSKAVEAIEGLTGLTPQGGTNLEEAMNLAYATALRHYLANGINRVVLLTDGAANLGDVDPATLKQKVEAHRKQGIALDCFGIGWEGFNDDLLETLSRNGDGRYGFINSPEEAATEFAAQLAGALKVAASDVKVQVEFNSKRVASYRQIGYARHQLTKEQFRDNTVDAAEIAAAESGNALYTVEMNPAGEGPLCTVRVRYKVPGTTDYREQEWTVPFTGNALPLDQAGPALRLAATASAFSEWLASSPFAAEVTPDKLLNQLGSVPETYGADTRPKKLEWMIRQAKSLSGK